MAVNLCRICGVKISSTSTVLTCPPCDQRRVAGQQFNVLPPGDSPKPKMKDDGKTYSDQYMKDPDKWSVVTGTGRECICEVTAFGMIINEKCTYPHKA